MVDVTETPIETLGLAVAGATGTYESVAVIVQLAVVRIPAAPVTV